MKYLETGELPFYSHLRMAEEVCALVECGETLEGAFATMENFRIPSTMMAIDALLEYGWERAVKFALEYGAKAEDILLPQDLAEVVGVILAKEFVESVKCVQEYSKVEDEELINFLKTLYQSEEIADEYGQFFGYWDLQNIYENHKGGNENERV